MTTSLVTLKSRIEAQAQKLKKRADTLETLTSFDGNFMRNHSARDEALWLRNIAYELFAIASEISELEQ